METLLPSEVARLVLGYLQENCEEAAIIFLERSSHLTECLELAKQGRKYTTKVMGNSLIDLLQEYCAVHCFVSERSQKLPENAAEQLKQSGSLVQKLTVLIDASKSGQTFLLSITVPSQGSGNQTTSTPASSGRSKSWLQSSSERAKRSSGARNQKSKEKEDKSGRRSSNSVEATPLHSLPGLSLAGNWSSSRDRADSNDDQADASGCSPPNCSTPRRKGPLPRKKLSASLSKLKKTHSEENDSNESVDISVLQQALLEKKQLHEKIAENINRVMRIPSDSPSESQIPVISLPDTLPVPCDGMQNELDQAIKTIVHQTAHDPLFESFLEEILGPVEEEVSSSPAAGDCESDTEETGSGSPPPPEAAVDESLNTPRASHSADEELGAAPGEVPLKQRLRSARNRASEGFVPTPSTPSTHGSLSVRLAAESSENEAPSPATKEQRKKESLLEEQNAAAIQSIITANIEKTVDDSPKTDLEKEANVNLDTQQCSGTNSTDNRDRKSAESQPTVNSHSENGEAESSVRDATVNAGQDCVIEISVPENIVALETGASGNSQQSVTYPGSKDGGSLLAVVGGVSSETQSTPGPVIRAVTCDNSEGSAAADSGSTFGTTASVTVPVSIEPSCIWEGLPVILTTPPDSQRQKVGMPIVQPVHMPLAVERGRMVLAMERPVTTATVAPAPLAVSIADQHPTVATSSIILYGGNQHFQPFSSNSLYQSPNFATVDVNTPLSIAPKSAKIAVREMKGTGENVVARSLTKTDVKNKQEVEEALGPPPADNKKNANKKLSSSKKKTKKKSGAKKNVSSHGKKKLSVAAQSSKEKKISLKKGNETLQKSEKNLASESSIILVDGAARMSSSIPDISYHESNQFGATKAVPLALDSRIQVTSSIDSSVESCSDVDLKHKSQAKDKDMPQVITDAQVNTHSDAANSHLKPVSDISANILNSNENSVDPDAGSCMKQKPDTGDTAHKPRQTPHVLGLDINKNTAEKSGSDCKPRQTPLVRRASTVTGGRLSLSTPRRRTSHIRALDFGTPPKSVTDSLLKRRSNSAPKDSAPDVSSSCSPDNSSDCRSQQAKNVRSSLFKSPDLPISRQHSDVLTPTLTVPIATRTPTPKLSGDWERVTGAGLIFGNSSPLLESPAREENNDLNSSGQSICATAGENCNSDERPSSPVDVALKSNDNCKNDSNKCEIPASNQEGALAVWRKSIMNYTKSKEAKRRAWDADLRAIVSQDYEDSTKKTNVRDKKKTVKRNKKKVDKETEEEARLLESRLESMMEEITDKDTEDGRPSDDDISVIVIGVEEGEVGKKSVGSTNEITENVPETSTCLEPKQTKDKSTVLLADTISVPSETSDNLEEKLTTSNEEIVEVEPDKSTSTVEKEESPTFVRPKQTPAKQTSRNRKRKAPGAADNIPKKKQKVKPSTAGREKKLKGKKAKGGNNDTTSSSAYESASSAGRSSGTPSSLGGNAFTSKMDGSEKDHTKRKANTEVSVCAVPVTDAISIVTGSESKDIHSVAPQSMYKEVNVTDAFISVVALETPQKVSTPGRIGGTGFQIPITPRIMSPSALLDTPISNFLREQPSIDLSMIPTPNFPPTPNIAVTPHSAELSSPTSYASRPTDYSSCSSYYKPSHSPSRTLEQVLIDECNRIESGVSPDRVGVKRSSVASREEVLVSQVEDGSLIQVEQQVTSVSCSANQDTSMVGDTQATGEVKASSETTVHSTNIEGSDYKQTKEKTSDTEVLEVVSEVAMNQHLGASVASENSVTVSKQNITATSETTSRQPSSSTAEEGQNKNLSAGGGEVEERINDLEKPQSSNKISYMKESMCNETAKTAKILEIHKCQQDTSAHSTIIKGSNQKRSITGSVPEPDIRTKRRISHSVIDLSVSSELERKKNRLMEKLKGGTHDTVKGTKVKEGMKKDKCRKKNNLTVTEKENNEKFVCKASASKESATLETSGVQNMGCEEPVLSEKVSVVTENTTMVIRSSEETSASKSVSATDRGTDSLTTPVTPHKGILLRRQGVSVNIIAERLLLEAQNPQVNRTSHTKESESRNVSESYLSAHVQDSDDIIECTVGQPVLSANSQSTHSVAQCHQKIDTAQMTIGSENEKSKSHGDNTVPNRPVKKKDNTGKEKNWKVSGKIHFDSACTNSKKSRNSSEISTQPEVCKITNDEGAGKEAATSSTSNEVHSLQEMKEDSRNITNKISRGMVHKLSRKEENEEDQEKRRKKTESNRKSWNKEGAEHKRRKDATSIKKAKKSESKSNKDKLTKCDTDNKSNELINVSGNVIVTDKCKAQETLENFSNVHLHSGAARNEINQQGSQPFDLKGDHDKEQDVTKAEKATKSWKESNKDCLIKSVVDNTSSEPSKFVGDPIVVERGKVQDTLETYPDGHLNSVGKNKDKRSEDIEPLDREREHDCPGTTTIKTSTVSRKNTVDSVYNMSDDICSKPTVEGQDIMQNTSENIQNAQHLNVDNSERDAKSCDDSQPSIVCNRSVDSSDMYVLIKYEGNGPHIQQKESEDLSDTTFTIMDEAGSRTLSVTGFLDLLTISPEKVSPRALNRARNGPDLTSESTTTSLIYEKESSVSDTMMRETVVVVESSHVRHSPKKPHRTGHSGSKTGRDRTRGGEIKHTNSSYKHCTSYKSLNVSESRASHKTKKVFQSPDKIMSKYRHGVRGSPRSTSLHRNRSVTPSRAPPRRPSTDSTKPRRLLMKSPRPPSKVSVSVKVDSVTKIRTPISRLNDVCHKFSHKRENVKSLKKFSSSRMQAERESVKHKKEACNSGHTSNSSDSMAPRDTEDSLQGAVCLRLRKVCKDTSVTDSGDDLMTYALMGSEREEDSNSSTQQQYNEAASRENWSDSHSSSHAVATSANEDVKTLPPKKRKPSSEDGLAQVEKKIHTEFSQKLLKGIDVDNFLNYVHDGEKRHKD